MAGLLDQKCPRCLDAHPVIRCPYVKAVELRDGDFEQIMRVEFLTPADYGRPVAPKVEDGAADNYPKLGINGASK